MQLASKSTGSNRISRKGLYTNMSYKQQSEKTKKLGDRGIRSVPEYEEVPAIPVSVKVRDLDMFYRVVNLLNSSVGKGKWNEIGRASCRERV